ncbi:hypothetical protein DIPPA_17064 [Diplonema papillatum]|nr:hypothetical protein DIPPA_17064 [Diplonema papillatum]
MVGANADAVRDSMLKCVIISLNDRTLKTKDVVWFDTLLGKLKKHAKAIIKQGNASEAETQLIQRVMSAEPNPPATIAEKTKVLKIWMRAIVPRSNFHWLIKYPAAYLQVILKLIDPEWRDADITEFPAPKKDLLPSMIHQWYGSTFGTRDSKNTVIRFTDGLSSTRKFRQGDEEILEREACTHAADQIAARLKEADQREAAERAARAAEAEKAQSPPRKRASTGGSSPPKRKAVAKDGEQAPAAQAASPGAAPAAPQQQKQQPAKPAEPVQAAAAAAAAPPAAAAAAAAPPAAAAAAAAAAPPAAAAAAAAAPPAAAAAAAPPAAAAPQPDPAPAQAPAPVRAAAAVKPPPPHLDAPVPARAPPAAQQPQQQPQQPKQQQPTNGLPEARPAPIAPQPAAAVPPPAAPDASDAAMPDAEAELSAEEKADVAEHCRGIRELLYGGDSEVLTLQQIVAALKTGVDSVERSVRILHDNNEIFYDDTMGVMYTI